MELNFLEGVFIFDFIWELCDFVEVKGYLFSGSFEICSWGEEELWVWFLGDFLMCEWFVVFGCGLIGLVYVLWFKLGSEVNDLFIVVLGLNGDLLVFVFNFFEFCCLLGCGYEEFEWDVLLILFFERKVVELLCIWFVEWMLIMFLEIGVEIFVKVN